MVPDTHAPYLQRINQHLSRTLDFAPEELALNRAGMMSQRQQEKFASYGAAQSKVARKIMLIVLAIAIPGFFLVFFTSFRDAEGGLDHEAAQIFPLVVIGVGLSLGLWVLMMLFGFRRMKRFQTANHQLKQVTGQAKTQHKDTHYQSAAVLSLAGQPTSYQYVTINRVNFYVTDEAAQAFIKDLNYRVYYVPLGGRVGMPVSAEAW